MNNTPEVVKVGTFIHSVTEKRSLADLWGTIHAEDYAYIVASPKPAIYKNGGKPSRIIYIGAGTISRGDIYNVRGLQFGGWLAAAAERAGRGYQRIDGFGGASELYFIPCPTQFSGKRLEAALLSAFMGAYDELPEFNNKSGGHFGNAPPYDFAKQVVADFSHEATGK